MKTSLLILLCFVMLLSACAPGNRGFETAPPFAPLHTPISTATSTPTRMPTTDTSAAPEYYAPIDASQLPEELQEFLARYDSLEQMNAEIKGDYTFIATEVNRRPAGTRDSSPLTALTRGISDCYETAVISALFGEKLGYKPYLLIFEHPVFSKKQPHSIHVFQDAATGKWGYNDYLQELREPTYATLKELADDFIRSHPVNEQHYDFWYLVDLTKAAEAYGLDWRTTSKHLRMGEKIIVEHGVYIPE